jgi:regulator of RNase E activity RraA
MPCKGAQALKAAGVVIDGRVRDLGEHRALKFPLFAKSVDVTEGKKSAA